MIEELIQNVLAETQRLTLEQASVVGLENIDESTFRSFFLRVLYEQCPDAMCQTEWKHRVDLLIQAGGENVLIEFKFFVHRPQWNLERTKMHWKGGAGAQNGREVQKDILDLHQNPSSPIHHKFLIIAYQPARPTPRKRSYGESYDSIDIEPPIQRVYRVPRNDEDGISIVMLTIE